MPIRYDSPRPNILVPPTVRAYASMIGSAIAETLWPTRCAVCDAPGETLCRPCRLNLPYIDHWRACPRCGAPFGRTQCTECNDVMLNAAGREKVPFDTCTCAVSLGTGPSRIVRAWKDGGERRLARDMADIMVGVTPPGWATDTAAVTFVPASDAALRRRGFDHGLLLASLVADRLSLPCLAVLSRPRGTDQRALNRKNRLTNAANSFSVPAGTSMPESLLLIDDVYTTGATLYDACDALRLAGAGTIRCLTFARA